jgi:uncharacterized small protein (DUF1192 family)
MNKHKLNSDERIAAMQERIDRLSDRSALSGQIEACVKSRDDLADRLNRVIAVADWRYGKNRRQEYQLAMLRKERERLQATLRRAGLSIMAHPGYTGEPNEEWTDLIESIEELVNILP